MAGLQAPLRPPAKPCMPGELSSGLAAHLGFETLLMHGHDICSWMALKALHIAAAVPAKGRLDLGSLEAPSRSARDPSKFRIWVSLIGNFALLSQHPCRPWLEQRSYGQGRAGQDTAHSSLGLGLE